MLNFFFHAHSYINLEISTCRYVLHVRTWKEISAFFVFAHFCSFFLLFLGFSVCCFVFSFFLRRMLWWWWARWTLCTVCSVRKVEPWRLSAALGWALSMLQDRSSDVLQDMQWGVAVAAAATTPFKCLLTTGVFYSNKAYTSDTSGGSSWIRYTCYTWKGLGRGGDDISSFPDFILVRYYLWYEIWYSSR